MCGKDKMFKLIFLGSGSAFTVGADNFQSNMLLISDQGDKFLIDAGSDLRFSLNSAGFSYSDITDIYISHLHSDHVGGLEYIGFSTLFDPRCKKPRLYLSKDIASQIWENTLSGGMKLIEGDIANLSTFFELEQLNYNGSFFWQGVRFNLVKTIHVQTDFFLMPSYGLFFQLGKVKIFLTTDTKFCFNHLKEFYQEADVIFHDCETSKYYQTPVHANYSQLITLPSEIKQKIWLYGYQPGELPDAKKDGFQGFVKRGQIFEFPSK
jgi:ribonuclease BN (tRNA processing enzyme)